MASNFTLTFTGDQENPPTGSTASGSGSVAWDSASNAATYRFTVSGVDFGPVLGQEAQTETTADDVTIHHVHNAPRGTNGPVVFGQIGPAQDTDDLSVVENEDGSWTVSGVWEATDPANVSITTFADALTAATGGSDVPLYFNVHTTTFPGGEIRAQWVAEAGADTGTGGGVDTGTGGGVDTGTGGGVDTGTGGGVDTGTGGGVGGGVGGGNVGGGNVGGGAGGGEVDWNAIAAQVQANFAATGDWFAPGSGANLGGGAGGEVDWDVVAAQVQANFAATGDWYF